MLELGLAPADRLKVFNCATCQESTKARRRCGEDREDFTDDDDATTFPIYIVKHGSMYGFCPAKATWDAGHVGIMRLLVIAAETGAMIEPGGLNEQPEWWIDVLAWFLPLYDNVKFYSRAMSIIGDGGKKMPGPKGK